MKDKSHVWLLFSMFSVVPPTTMTWAWAPSPTPGDFVHHVHQFFYAIDEEPAIVHPHHTSQRALERHCVEARLWHSNILRLDKRLEKMLGYVGSDAGQRRHQHCEPTAGKIRTCKNLENYDSGAMETCDMA